MQGGFLPAEAGDFVAVHDGEADIEQDDVGLVRCEPFRALACPSCAVCTSWPSAIEQLLEAGRVQEVIVDDENSPARQLRRGGLGRSSGFARAGDGRLISARECGW